MSFYKSFDDYRKAWDNASDETPPIPLNVDLELASTCNLKCPFCFIPDPSFEKFISQKSDDGKPIRRLMPKEMAFRLIDECDEIGVPALKFNWRGESTLHPDYSEIVKYAKNKKDSIGSLYATVGVVQSWPSMEKPSFLELLANTNANCSDRAIDGLMACTKVMVSLDSMMAETYKQMRVGGNLSRAWSVIDELIGRGHTNVWARRVLTKLNFKEPFFEQVKSKWGDKIHVSEHSCFDRNDVIHSEISGCDHDNPMPRKYCGYPSQRLIITSRGLAYPCCLDLHETMPVGDTNKQKLLEIWQGKQMNDLRSKLKSLKSETWSETCRNCESWMSYDAPQRNFVQDREGVKIEIGSSN